MNKLRKCPMCKGKTKIVMETYNSKKLDAKTGEKIVVKDIPIYVCEDKQCEHTWLPSDLENKIDREIAKRSRFDLSCDEIRLIRESLPFSTKLEVANFLSLNEKAFTKWELGHSEPNRAYDLLLRLCAFSQRNVDFIRVLHKKNFKFDPNDYELIPSRPSAINPAMYVFDSRKINDKETFTSMEESNEYACDSFEPRAEAA